jgi:hypothetical protein
MRFLLCALTAAVLATRPATAGAMGAGRNGDGYVTTSDGAPAGVTIQHGNTTCKMAKRVLKTYLHAKTPCAGSACLRKVSGWTCLAASPARYPRVASCSRGEHAIVAHAIVD